MKKKRMCVCVCVCVCECIHLDKYLCSRSWCPRGRRRRSEAAPLLGLWFRLPPGNGCLSVLLLVKLQTSPTGFFLDQGKITDRLCDTESDQVKQ